MLLVQKVSGPASAKVGDAVTYEVTQFNQTTVSAAKAAGIHWLVKSSDGGALLAEHDVGPKLALTVPDTWAGQTVAVMPYLRSPSTAIAVTTTVAEVPAPPIAAGAAIDVEIFPEGKRFYASVDGQPRFFVGTDVPFKGFRGLMNSRNPPGPRYRGEDYEAKHGDWAWYLLPTITCESQGFFTCLNTYDRAHFTFGHIQLAAHTENDNFVLVLRELLALPLAATYFPDLTVKNGRVHERTASGLKALESADTTKPLMLYFNPTRGTVETSEVKRAARMVDWCVRDAAFRDLFVDFSVRQQRKKLAGYASELPLNGVVDKLCLVVLDIRHQGRAKNSAIRTALASPNPFDSLLGLGSADYAERITTLRAGIRDLEALGKVGRKVYDAAKKDFVVPDGA